MTDRDPLDENDHADRYDRDGDRWEWCDGCDGFRGLDGHGMHKSGYGWTAAELDEGYGPVTFAPQPADTSPQPASDDLPASQPEPDQQDTPTRPSKALPPEIDAALTRALADAWDEGYEQAVEFERRWWRSVRDGETAPVKPTNPYRQFHPEGDQQ